MTKNGLNWKLLGKYADREKASAEDPYPKMWHMTDRRTLREMIIERYHCKNKKLEGCPAQKRVNILFKDGSYQVELVFEHKSICQQKSTEVADLKNEIISIYNSGCSQPWKIKSRMDENGKEVNIEKIYQMVYKHKRKSLNAEDITVTKVNELCEELNRIRAEEVFSDKKGYIADMILDRDEIKILITTKNSLILLSKAENIHVDATYRVIDVGYPVIVLGMTDVNQKFILLAMSIVGDEKMETYFWVLDVLRKECEKYGLIFNPKNLIADLAPQISQAISQFEPDCLRTHCWVHVLKGMKRSMDGLLPCLREEILSDIFFLQLINTKRLFEKGWALLFEKWRQIRQTEECIIQLHQNYYLDNGNWYEGYAVHSPSTNNALERFNLTIKTRYTNWGRMTILEFIRLSVAAVEDYAFVGEKVPWKIQYNEAVICQDDRSSGMVFKQLGNMDGHINYLFAAASNTEREKEELLSRKLENLNFATFNEFKDLLSKTTIVSTKDDIQSLKDIFCSCRHFVKKKKCCHIYAFLARSGKKELLNSELIFVKKKRGRPKGVKKNAGLVRE